MKSLRYNMSSIGLSVLLNVGVLLALMFIQRAVAQQSLEMVLESIFTEEPPQEEITRDLQLDTAPAETLNVIAGGTP